eukprot:NODE_308_length_11287_cov_0.209778.p1 type:complete len:1191 gc:universal NODE_308_length_11287_cov_0.209778:1986-5558(+)
MVFFNYFNAVVWKGYKRPLEIEDTLVIGSHIKAEKVRTEIEDCLEDHLLKKKEPMESLQRNDILNAIFKAFGKRFLWAGMLKFINDSAMLATPLLQEFIIRYIQDYKRDKNSVEPYMGYVYVVVFFLLNVVQAIAINYYFINSMTCGLQVRTSLTTIIYKKILKMNPSLFNSGTIINLVSTDASRLEFTASYLHMIWSAPFQLFVIIAFLIRALGWIALIGVAAIFFVAPFQSILFKRLGIYRKASQIITDSRVKQTNEALQSMRLIKCFGWEPLVLNTLQDLRKAELLNIFKLAILSTITFGLAQVVPTIASVLTYVTYLKLGNDLEPAIIFSSLSYFNLLFTPLLMLPFLLSGIVDSRVALTRLSDLLKSNELDNHPTIKDPTNTDYAVQIENGTFSWDMVKEVPMTILHDMNIKIRKGSLTVIVGSVGCGKSSLLQAIIGEMRKIHGNVSLSGSVGYAPQIAWIQNGTLKDNVLFGLPFDKQRYQDAITLSQLSHDLEILPDGDSTEIGEKGINLSGGQKARVSLARVYYFNPDIILLDDVLSAVDSHVANSLFFDLIKNGFKSKTILLVTHQLHVVPSCDNVIFMENGVVSGQGEYSTLLKSSQTFKTYMNNVQGQMTENVPEGNSVEPSANDTAKPAVLMTAEERFSGAVKWRVYSSYLKAGYGFSVGSAVILVYLILNANKIGANLWLAYYTQGQMQIWGISVDVFIIVYCILGISQSIFVVGTGVVGAIGGYKASKILHENAILRVMNAPMSFFDTNPLGRILNRFSKDQDALDSQLPQSLRSFLTTFFTTIFSFAYMIVVTPLLAAPLVLLLVAYYFIQDFYRCTSRELKRIDAISKSPVYSLIGESMNGLSTIRAYREEERFMQLLDNHVDKNNRPAYSQLVAQRWLSLRLELIGAVLIFFAALFGIIGKDTIPVGVIALSLTYALSTTSSLNWCVRQLAELEVYMNSVERINFYAEELPTEKPKRVDSDPTNWPVKAQVEFKNCSMSYRPGLPDVLKDVNLSIPGGLKIGIVGRTGSGKSSLTVALMRLVEINKGQILIDGVDIATIGLHTLRKRIAIVPQDPVLFSGTIRSNLDRYGEFDEAKLWSVLERVGLKASIEILDKKLDSIVSENGENYSVGQRQLFCLARAMLLDSNIIIMDEASASVDVHTDRYIQEAIRRDFNSKTILTIAHRLGNTVLM